MQILYVLKNSRLAVIRKVLAALAVTRADFSSCYFLAGNYWVVFRSQALAPAGSHSYAELVARSDPAESLLLAWAKSELEQTNTFCHYEDAANCESNGCSLMVADQQVVRSYLPLTEIMLIINCTPDSFSGGAGDLATTISWIKGALAAGVTILDVGAESTRPGAQAIDSKQEIARLKPLINELGQLRSSYCFKLSLDSYQPATIRYFLSQIDIVNDVSGRLGPELLLELIAEDKTYAFMHSLTIPADPSICLGTEVDPLTQLHSWGQDKIAQLLYLGFRPEQLILDVGIGFNKTMAQSWYLIRNLAKLTDLGVELLLGHSRKRFLNKISSRDFASRDLETAIVANYLQRQGAAYLRVHDYRDLLLVNRISNQLGE